MMAPTATSIDVRGFSPAGALRVFGLPRSGNHAIINWLTRNAPGDDGYVFLNDCALLKNPFESYGHFECNGERLRARRLPPEMLGERLPSGRPWLLVSYESIGARARRAGRQLSPGLTNPFDVLILRSPLNWLASLVRMFRTEAAAKGQSGLAVMRRAADALTEYHDALTLADETETIVYDRWVSDPTYRQSRLAALGWPMLDNSLGAVQTYGGGSSFPATEGAVTERWHAMRHDPIFAGLARVLAEEDDALLRIKRHFPDDALRLTDSRLGDD